MFPTASSFLLGVCTKESVPHEGHVARWDVGQGHARATQARAQQGNGGGGSGVLLTNMGARACHDAYGSRACALDPKKKHSQVASHVGFARPCCSAEITQDIFGNLGYEGSAKRGAGAPFSAARRRVRSWRPLGLSKQFNRRVNLRKTPGGAGGGFDVDVETVGVCASRDSCLQQIQGPDGSGVKLSGVYATPPLSR